MADPIIIGIVVVLTLGAHYWLYLWIKFRIDEGVVLVYLQADSADLTDSFFSTKAISLETGISVKRVLIVCNKSNKIKMRSQDSDSWRIIA